MDTDKPRTSETQPLFLRFEIEERWPAPRLIVIALRSVGLRPFAPRNSLDAFPTRLIRPQTGSPLPGRTRQTHSAESGARNGGTAQPVHRSGKRTGAETAGTVPRLISSRDA